jgi:hypothetical protein
VIKEQVEQGPEESGYVDQRVNRSWVLCTAGAGLGLVVLAIVADVWWELDNMLPSAVLASPRTSATATRSGASEAATSKPEAAQKS